MRHLLCVACRTTFRKLHSSKWREYRTVHLSQTLPGRPIQSSGTLFVVPVATWLPRSSGDSTLFSRGKVSKKSSKATETYLLRRYSGVNFCRANTGTKPLHKSSRQDGSDTGADGKYLYGSSGTALSPTTQSKPSYDAPSQSSGQDSSSESDAHRL